MDKADSLLLAHLSLMIRMLRGDVTLVIIRRDEPGFQVTLHKRGVGVTAVGVHRVLGDALAIALQWASKNSKARP